MASWLVGGIGYKIGIFFKGKFYKKNKKERQEIKEPKIQLPILCFNVCLKFLIFFECKLIVVLI